MGMVLEHELSACYAAGSLGGTLGRLNDSIERLSRAQCTGSRETPGEAGGRFIKPARLAYLNQTQRLMADAWQMRKTASHQFSHLVNLLDSLKENTLSQLNPDRKRAKVNTYHVLAQALDKLRIIGQIRM